MSDETNNPNMSPENSDINRQKDNAPKSPEKENDFHPSWLVQNKEELDKWLGGRVERMDGELDSNETLLRSLHRQAQKPPDERWGGKAWATIHKRLNTMQYEGIIKPNPFTDRIGEYIKHLNKEDSTHDESKFAKFYSEPNKNKKRKSPPGSPKKPKPPRESSSPPPPTNPNALATIIDVSPEGAATVREEPATSSNNRETPPPDVPGSNNTGENTPENLNPHDKLMKELESFLNAFRDIETWNKERVDRIQKTKLGNPDWLEKVVQDELSKINARIELNNAAYYKRYEMEVPNLESLSKNKDLERISQTETEILLRIPGVWEALKEYVSLYRDPARLDELKEFRKAKTETDVMMFREKIQNSIREHVASGHKKDLRDTPTNSQEYETKIKNYSKDAEQIAFNLHFIANFFETEESKWSEDGKRLRKPESISPVLAVPIRNAMSPLDTLVDATTKFEKGAKDVGAFGEWARIQTQKSIAMLNLSEQERENLRWDEVEILPNTKENKDRFWTIEEIQVQENGQTRKGYKLYVFEAYPREYIKSAWEETVVKIDSVERTILSFLENEDSTINSLLTPMKSQNLWGMYDVRLGSAAKLWDYLQGKEKINVGLGGGGGPQEWVDGVNKTAAEFEWRTNPEIKRLVLHASIPIKIDSRALRVDTNRDSLETEIGTVYRYLKPSDVLYPWDKPTLFEKTF